MERNRRRSEEETWARSESVCSPRLMALQARSTTEWSRRVVQIEAKLDSSAGFKLACAATAVLMASTRAARLRPWT